MALRHLDAVRFRREKRRGFVFTSIAVLLVATLIIIAWADHRGVDRARTRAEHALTTQSYILNVEQDLPRAAYISSFRCFLALEEHMSETGEYLEDFDAAFSECFANGTIDGTVGALMEDSSFSDLSQRFSDLASQRGLRVSIALINATAVHEEPFAVTTHLFVVTTIQDNSSSISINRTTELVALVPITDLKDPLHSVGTLGRIPRPVNVSTIGRPYIDASNDTTQLLALINTGAYVTDSSGPDFIMRFEGNLSASEHGIASLVDLEDLAAQDLPIDDCKSIVDYKYFGAADTTPNNLIVNTAASFVWLSDDDLDDYDATDKTNGTKACT